MGARALHQVAQRVEDLDRAVAFYRDVLGLRFVARFGGLAFFDLDGTRLLLEQGAPPALLYLRVDDVVAGADALRSQGVQLEGDARMIHRDDDGTFGPAGEEEWMAFFRDSEGNVLALAGRRRP